MPFESALLIEIRFVGGLESKEVVAENILALFCDLEAPVDGVVEGDAQEPLDVQHLRDISSHIEHVDRVQDRRGFGLRHKLVYN